MNKKTIGLATVVILLIGSLHVHRFARRVTPASLMRNTVEVIGSYGLGTGTIFKSDDTGSLILTNKHVCQINKLPMAIALVSEMFGQHVIANYSPFKIVIEGEEPVPGDVVEVADNADLCVISVPSLKNHSVIKFAKRQGHPGDYIITTGFPLGVPGMVAQGFQATVQDLGEGRTFLMVSLLTYPGQSGSGIFNIEGELIGVVTIGIPSAPSIGGATPLAAVLHLTRKYLN